MSALESILRLLLLVCGLLGFPIGYAVLCSKMRKAHLRHPPYFHFFLVFGSCGGFCITLAMISATPIAIAFAFISEFLSPAVLLISSCFIYRRYSESRYHAAAFKSGIIYLCLMTSLILFVASLTYLERTR